MRSKIGWCNLTWNPVWGCKNHCEYCYARGMAKRFAKEMAENECHYRWKNNIGTNPYTKRAFIECTERFRNFIPTFLYSQFNKKLPKKPQRIFVGSMSEIAHWEKEWIEMVIEKVKQHPQHIFQLLTKHPGAYGKWLWPENCWLGITITDNATLRDAYFAVPYKRVKFISIEPILREIDLKIVVDNGLDVNWVIVGAETGNRRGKIIPKEEWIERIVHCCREMKIPIYLKDSLKSIYPREIKEFPKGREGREG